MSRIGRREFLGGAALAGAAALGCRRGRDPYRIEKPPVSGSGRAGEERWVLSTCGLCEAGCGIKVRVVEGRAVKIEGNAEHPVNRGGLCCRGQAALQALYHPERLRSPLRRVGDRGAGQWKPISWDEAIGEVATKLHDLRAAGHPERLVLVDGDSGTFTYDLWTRFLLAFGSPNHIGLGSARAAGLRLATLYTQGRYGLPTHDLDRARLVLAMGTDLLESSGQAMNFLRASSGPARPRVIGVSPRRPGCRIDEWIPIAPGGYGALALSLAHVLIRDGLIDRGFFRERVFGFAAWRDPAGVEQPGFEALVLGDYAPEKTQDATGVPAATVQRLAQALAKQGPAVVASDGGAVAASNGLATAMAIAALNALVGNGVRQGGVRGRGNEGLVEWEAPTVDAVATAGSAALRIDGMGTAACPLGRGRVHAVPAAINQANPYPVEALFLHNTDPLTTLPGRQAWAAALKRVPFVVSFSAWPDPTARLADLVLPASSFLEAWEIVRPALVADRPVLSYRQPVVAPARDARQAGDVILALAAGLGGSMGRSLPWKSYADVVANLLPAEARTAIKETGTWQRACVDDPLCKPEPGDAKAGAFPTPSTKFEMVSQVIVSRLAATRDAARSSKASPAGGLPIWEQPRFSGDPLQFPLHLVPYRPVSFVEDGGHPMPWLSELPLVSGDPWPVRAEINPVDAARLGLADGDRVMVESPMGSCEAVAHLSDGVRAGAVAMALGKGGVVDLVVPEEDRWSGLLDWQGTRVRLRKHS